MIMAKDSNNNYVKIEDIKQQNIFFNGVFPIKFKGSGENLENYRIYGNTVDGESVGDRTANLFENLWKKGYIRADNGREEQIDGFICSGFFPVEYGQTYSISRSITVGYDNIRGYRDDGNFIGAGTDICDVTNPFPSSATKIGAFTVTNENVAFIRFNDSANDLDMKYMIVDGTYTEQTMPSYEPYGYRVPVMVTNGMDAQTTNIYLPEQIKKVGDEAEYIDYGEQKQHRVRKNLLSKITATYSRDGILLISESDGTLSVNGIATETVFLRLKSDVSYPFDTILSGCAQGGSREGYYLRAQSTLQTLYSDFGNGALIPANTQVFIEIRIQKGTECNNLEFKPMIRKADIEDDTYEPYIENTDLDVTLPALPTLSGTNTLSVETNIKPSKVWGKLSDLRDILYVKDNLGNILFSKYHEIEGESPLIYKAKKADTLTDYRIYGAEGNVGNLRPSLVAATDFTNGYHVATDGTIGEHGKRVATLTPIDVSAINTIYVNSGINTLSNPVIIYSLFSDDTFIERLLVNGIETVINTEGANKLYLSFGGESKVTTANLNNVYVMDNDKMYVIPVTIAGKNKFDGTLFNGYYTDSTMTSIGGVSGNYKSCKVYLSAGTYTFSSNIPVLIVRYITADSYISNPTSGQITQTHTFVVSDDGYVSFAFRNAENIPWDDSTMIQIEEAQTATEYEPYHDPINTNIYLPEQIKMVGDKAEYADYQEQKLHRVRKNLLQNTASSQTKNGVTFTVNNDGSVTCDGTASNNTFFKIGDFSLASQSYILTGCPSDGGNDSYALRCYKNGNIKGADVGNGFNINESIDGYIEIRIASGYTCNNLIFYPMIRKADITDDTYESYITNPELDVTLPALPTLSGINTLSVGTGVQPSKIKIKGKVKGKIYGWHVDPDISNSSSAVTYLEDAREMIPASMGSSTFDYGSWENAFFMPKPCMLKSNGKVDYYLDPNDYTKKLNGTASDIANPNYDGNAMMEWPKIWFKYVKGVKKGQGYFYVANYKADGNFHCWCNYDSEDNEIDHFYTAIYNGTSFANYNSSKTYVVNDFAIYNNKLYKCNTAIVTAESFDSTKWDIVSNTAPVINKMRSLSGIRLTNNNGNAQTDTTTEVTRATANNTTSAAEWYIETFSDRLLINGLLVLMGKSLNTQAVFGRGLDTGGQPAKEAYVTGTLNDKGLFWGVTENGNSGVKIFGMENFWGCCWHRTAGLITNNHAVKLKLTYGTKDGSTVVGYNQTGNGYIDNGISPYSNGYVQKMSYNKYGFMPAVVTGGSQSTYYADYYYQNANYTGIIYALFGGSSADGLSTGAFYLRLYSAPEHMFWIFAASLSCKPLLN